MPDAWIIAVATDTNGNAKRTRNRWENEGIYTFVWHVCVLTLLVSKCAHVCMRLCMCVCKSSHRTIEIQLYGHMHVFSVVISSNLTAVSCAIRFNSKMNWFSFSSSSMSLLLPPSFSTSSSFSYIFFSRLLVVVVVPLRQALKLYELLHARYENFISTENVLKKKFWRFYVVCCSFWLLFPLPLMPFLLFSMRIEAKTKRCKEKCWQTMSSHVFSMFKYIEMLVHTTISRPFASGEKNGRNLMNGSNIARNCFASKNIFANAFKWIWRQYRNNIIPSIDREKHSLAMLLWSTLMVVVAVAVVVTAVVVDFLLCFFYYGCYFQY